MEIAHSRKRAVRSTCDSGGRARVTNGLQRLLPASAATGTRHVSAGQRLVIWWSGAGSNRRPSAFQTDDQPQTNLEHTGHERQ